MGDVRLIDANAMLIQAEHLCTKTNYDFLKRWVDTQATAYDVDKVVEEMKANAKKMSETTLPHTYYKAIGTRKCEEIIRNGGQKKILCFESGNKYYVHDEQNKILNHLVFANSPMEAAYEYCGKPVVRVGRNAPCDFIVESKKGKYHYKISKY